jgi:hypothetical protein
VSKFEVSEVENPRSTRAISLGQREAPTSGSWRLWLVEWFASTARDSRLLGGHPKLFINTSTFELDAMSDYFDENEPLDLPEDVLQILDAPFEVSLGSPLARSAPQQDLELGSVKYCTVYKEKLVQKAQEIAGITPYDWQLEASLATHLGRDVFILAGTGFGKTLPFVMNCWLDKSLIVWIVSPLNALANQQAKTFASWGITSVAVNSTTTDAELYKVHSTSLLHYIRAPGRF